MRKAGDADIRPGLVGGIGDEIRPAAPVAIVAPDVPQVQPVPDLVRGGATQVERRCRRAGCAERGAADHHTVGCRGAAGELRIAQQAPAERASPQVEIVRCGPRVVSAGGGRFDRVVVSKPGCAGCPGSGDPVGGVSRRIGGRQPEGDPRVRCERRKRCGDAADIAVALAKIVIERSDLAIDLRLRKIFGRIAMDHVDDHVDLGAAGPLGDLHHLGTERRLFDALAGFAIALVGVEQAVVDRHRSTNPHGRQALAVAA